MPVRIALLSLYTTTLLAGMAVSPLLPSLAEAFGQDGEYFAKLFFTLPSIIVIPFLFISGSLSIFFSKKHIILTGLVLYIISGIGCFIFFDKYTLIFFRCLTGVAAGLVMPYSASLIAEYYQGKKRTQIFGQAGIISNIMGIILIILGGILVDIYWKLGFLVMLIAFLPLLLIKNNIKSKGIYTSKKTYPLIFHYHFKPVVFKICFIYCILASLIFVYFANVPFLIKQNQVGSPINAGIAQAFYMFAALIANISMPKIKKRSLKWLIFIQLMLISIGFLMLGLLTSLKYIYIGSFFLGLGYGSIGSLLVVLISENTSKLSRVNALAMLTGAMYLGQFISPLLFTEIMIMLDITKYSIAFLIEGIIFSIIICYIGWTVIKNIRIKKYENRNLKRDYPQ
jgi:MFS family permease